MLAAATPPARAPHPTLAPLRCPAGALAGCGNASQLPALFALMEGVCQHEYLGMRRRLEADFALFADAGRGVRPGGGAAAGRPLKRLSSIEAHERRFLTDFISAMFSAHYRLLGKEEWEAAASEAFLFTLPVTVDWGALDRRMLQRYWGDHPEQRAELPDLSDRILIFCRGFEPVRACGQEGRRASATQGMHLCQASPTRLPPSAPCPMQARMRGRYLWHKIELLLQFFLLSPLWAGVVWALQQVSSSEGSGCPLGFCWADVHACRCCPRCATHRWGSGHRRRHHWLAACPCDLARSLKSPSKESRLRPGRRASGGTWGKASWAATRA